MPTDLGFSFREIPIYFAERQHGKSKMSFRIQAEAALRVWLLPSRYRDRFRKIVRIDADPQKYIPQIRRRILVSTLIAMVYMAVLFGASGRWIGSE